MLHLHYGLSDSEQADAAGNAPSSLTPGAAGDDLAANAQAAGAASDAGNEAAPAGAAAENSPFTVAPGQSSSNLAASPTPEQIALADARDEGAARPTAKSRQSSLSAPPGAAKLREILITERDGSLRLSLITGERSSYDMFRLGNPNRVVVDIPGTWITLPADRLLQEISHPLVQRIRLGQFKANPPIARLVLDVEGFPNLLLFPHSRGLDIQVSNTTD